MLPAADSIDCLVLLHRPCDLHEWLGQCFTYSVTSSGGLQDWSIHCTCRLYVNTPQRGRICSIETTLFKHIINRHHYKCHFLFNHGHVPEIVVDYRKTSAECKGQMVPEDKRILNFAIFVFVLRETLIREIDNRTYRQKLKFQRIVV